MGVKLGGRGEAYTGFWWGNLKVRDHLGDPDVDEKVTLTSSGIGMWISTRLTSNMKQKPGTMPMWTARDTRTISKT
jgi:hypothetical protein